MNRLDRIKGAIFGYALGDALGLGTEFMNRHEVNTYYPGGLRNFGQIICDSHRCQWEKGEWTNDTEIVVRLLESMMRDGALDVRHFAASLREWHDANDKEMIPVLRRIMESDSWVADPIVTAHRIWQSQRFVEASNEAVGRGIAVALLSRREDLLENTRKAVLVTHDDSRCVVSTMVIAKTAFSLLHGEEPDFSELQKLCDDLDRRVTPYLLHARDCEDIADLELDDEETMAYTRKTMAAALWALWHAEPDPAETFFKVIDAGGDADTNAAAAGALLGLKYGYDAIPDEKKKLLKFDYLNDLAERVTDRSDKINLQK